MDMHPPSDEEYDALPHVVLTSDMDWDPAVVDNELDFDEWLEARMEEDDLPGPNSYCDYRFDQQGYYQHQVYRAHFFDAYQDLPAETYDDIVDAIDMKYIVKPHEVTSQDPHFESLRPNFAWAPVEVIKRTFDVTTRWARCIECYPFRQHCKSRFPALNVHRRREPIAMDTIYSDTLAIDNGATSAQILVGT